MPVVSEAQRKFFGACSNPKNRSKACPPVKVAKEFLKSTPKGKKLKEKMEKK